MVWKLWKTRNLHEFLRHLSNGFTPFAAGNAIAEIEMVFAALFKCLRV